MIRASDFPLGHRIDKANRGRIACTLLKTRPSLPAEGNSHRVAAGNRCAAQRYDTPIKVHWAEHGKLRIGICIKAIESQVIALKELMLIQTPVAFQIKR